jgi:bifunctional non-homologous end joining protein LigD
VLTRSSSRRYLPLGFIEPCLPTLARTVPDGPQWAHEIKHDGYRMICRRDGDRVRVFTRRGHDWTDRVPRIAEALALLRGSSATIDGEAVLCDDQGVADFDRLRGALARRGGSREPFLYAFDLLELNGMDLRPQPWIGRREALASLLATVSDGDGIALSEHLDGPHGSAMFRVACGLRLEGIVSKRVDRPYRSGRSPDWVKVKNPVAPAASRVIER